MFASGATHRAGRMPSADRLSVAMHLAANLIRDHQDNGLPTSAIIDQAVEAGMLIGQQTTGRNRRREQ
jgi:hypothetical protein